MSESETSLLAFIAANPELAALLVAATSFGESFPVLNFFVPGGVVLIGAGALAVTGILDPYAILAAAVAGTMLGDVVAYSIGRKFGTVLLSKWPFRKHPETLERGVGFFKRYGHASVFIGRFFGPLRTIVPTTAGISRMHFGEFTLSTLLSALIYAPALMFSGYLLNHVLSSPYSVWYKVALIAALAGLLVLAVHALRRVFHVK
jgi:membrane protein DedA with SNARE-associated domain